MFTMTATVNYKDNTEREVKQSYQSEWALLDHIQQLMREPDTSSFVFVVGKR